MNLSVNEVFNRLPQHKYPVGDDEIRTARGDKIIIVLDDDPTGTQTVNNVPVLTDWSLDCLSSEFKRETGLFYILTNSRSMIPSEVQKITKTITENIKSAAGKTNQEFIIISRSDSTLRGHYPLETDGIAEALNLNEFLTVINPAFFEGGRVTIDNQHYVIEEGYLIRASDTPFARDEVFGYSDSNLYNYVIEKSSNRLARDDIFDLSINEIRNDPIEKITGKIIKNRSKKVLIVNAANYDDERKAVCCILYAMNRGINFIFRTAASIVPVIGSIQVKPLLEKSYFKRTNRNRAGVIIVGSHVPKTTRQLNFLLDNTGISSIKLQVNQLIEDKKMEEEISRISRIINNEIKNGNSIVLFTSRELIKAPDKRRNLEISQRISSGIVRIIDKLEQEPSFIIAKGGITSSDIATKALNIKRAVVKGQILPGIPVWESEAGTKFPGIDYVVFPGNVGNDRALYNAYEKLK